MSFETNYKIWHTRASYIKSGIRIVGCAIAAFTGSIVILASFLAVAELVGVVEEWV